jgi:DNA-binding transcriptional regulator YiaG
MLKEIDGRKELESWERAKIAHSAPNYEELRCSLGLKVERFCELLNIDRTEYIKWRSGEGQPSIDQKLLFKAIYDTARKKGLILD